MLKNNHRIDSQAIQCREISENLKKYAGKVPSTRRHRFCRITNHTINGYCLRREFGQQSRAETAARGSALFGSAAIEVDVQSIVEMFSLEGRTALVTGASRGLGRTFAHTLAKAGASVMISAKNAEALAQAKQAFSKAGISVKTQAAELRDRQQIEKLAKAAEAEFGHVDILVANAGISGTAPVESFSPEGMDELVEINLLAPMLLTRLLVPGMKEKKWGRLIYLSSVAAFVSSEVDGHAIYSATKAGLNGFMRTAAIELGAFGITANSIAPGTFLTDMAQRSLDSYGEEGRASYDKYAKMNALHRWGNVDELKGPLLLLASDAGSFVTGSVLTVDGGFTVRSTPAQ